MNKSPSVPLNKTASTNQTAAGTINCPIHKGFWIQRPVGNTLWGEAKTEQRECPGCVTDLAVKASQMSVSSHSESGKTTETGSTIPETVFTPPSIKSQLGQPNVVELFIDDEDFSGHYTGEMKDKKRH